MSSASKLESSLFSFAGSDSNVASSWAAIKLTAMGIPRSGGGGRGRERLIDGRLLFDYFRKYGIFETRPPLPLFPSSTGLKVSRTRAVGKNLDSSI